MPLSAFDQAGLLNPCAALEQAILSYTLYFRGTEGAMDLLRQTGNLPEVLARNDQEPDWSQNLSALPIFVCYRLDGQFWLLVKGTYTSLQWVKNVTGFFTRSGLGTNTGVFHGAWATMAEEIWALVRPRVAGGAYTLNVSGHSLGGAVAWMVGVLAKQYTPTQPVNVLTLGCPRTEKGIFSGAAPTTTHHVQTRHDVVVFLPPNLPPGPPAWDQQTGPKTVFSIYGDSVAPSVNDGEVDVRNIASTDFTIHYPGTYVRALQAHAATLSTSCNQGDALLVAAGFANESGKPIPVPLTDAPAITTRSGGGTMNFKVTMFFGYKKWGFTESHYWSGSDRAACVSDCMKLGALRRGFMHLAYTLEGFRVQTCDERGKTFLATGSEMIYTGAGVGEGRCDGLGAGCAPIWRALYVRIYSGAPAYAGNHYLRGAPDNLACFTISAPAANAPGYVNQLGRKTGKNAEAFGAYLAFLCNTPTFERELVSGALLGGKPAPTPPPFRAAATVAAGGWSFKVRNQEIGRGASKNIDGVLVDADTGYVWIKPAPGNTLTVHQRIHIHGLTGPGLTGLNGDTRVAEIGTVAPTLGYYRLTKKQSPRCDFAYRLGGTYWLLADTLVPYTYARIGRVVKRNTGHIFFGTDGRGKKKCDRFGNRIV